jgi:SRSO17 transposase
MAGRFNGFVKTFSDLFISYRRDVTDKALHYLSGLMQAGPRKNMERMCEVVPESDHQAVQQFISDSRWDSQAVNDRVAQNANKLIGSSREACLLIDESGFPKKGDKSVGVSRQWLGCLGKVDNGQVGVFSALCNGGYAVPVDSRLYLPQEWIDDPARCLEAKVPEDKIIFKTKDQLALEMVAHARELGLRYGWVGADAGYGKGLGFCMELEKMNETFMVDIHSDQMIYMEKPNPFLPTPKGRGKKFTRYQIEEKGVRVDKWVAEQPDDSWRKITLRNSTKGKLTYEFMSVPIWLWVKDTQEVRCWHFVVRRNPDTHSDYKYSLSNAPKGTKLKRLARMQSQRFWIERSFEDGKSECGMADYQLRGWIGWHHHMALVKMAMLFMLQERIESKDEYPLLSCGDIEKLLAWFLPRRDTTKEEIIRQVKLSHAKRKAAMESAARVQLRRRRRKPPG